MTTTHTPARRYNHRRPYPSHLRPYHPTQSGQHFSLFLGVRDSRKPPPQLPQSIDLPAHTANTQQCTRVTPPHHTHHPGRVKPSQPPPSPPPRCGGHRVIAGTHARAQRSAVSLRAHFTAILTEWHRQAARKRERDEQAQKSPLARHLVSAPPAHTTCALSRRSRARADTEWP
jgi:hypothetical protein